MHHLTILMILDIFLVPLLRSGLESQIGNNLMSTIAVLRISNNTGWRHDKDGNLTSLFEEMDKHLEKFEQDFQGSNHSQKVIMVENVKQDQKIAFEDARKEEKVVRLMNETRRIMKKRIKRMETELAHLNEKIRNDTIENGGGGLLARFADKYKRRKLERRVPELESNLADLKQQATILKDEAARAADLAMRKLITWAELKRIEVEYQNKI